jgi:hypothetical protein
MGVGVGCSVDTKFHEYASIDFDEVKWISLQKKGNLGSVKCMWIQVMHKCQHTRSYLPLLY